VYIVCIDENTLTMFKENSKDEVELNSQNGFSPQCVVSGLPAK
jgi:hypothetical protein